MSVGGKSLGIRLWRRVWPGGNPLRRRTDWFEFWAFLVVVVLAAVSLALAVTTTQTVRRDEMAAVHAEHTQRHEINATVVSQLERREAEQPVVVVRWGPAGHESFGVANLGHPVRTDDTVRVWINQQNQLTPPPTSPSAATQTAGVAGASVLIGCSLVTAVGYGCARWYVNRRRLAAWGAEWEYVEPQWRRRTG